MLKQVAAGHLIELRGAQGYSKEVRKGKNGKQNKGASTATVSLSCWFAFRENCKAKNAKERFSCPFYNGGMQVPEAQELPLWKACVLLQGLQGVAALH